MTEQSLFSRIAAAGVGVAAIATVLLVTQLAGSSSGTGGAPAPVRVEQHFPSTADAAESWMRDVATDSAGCGPSRVDYPSVRAATGPR